MFSLFAIAWSTAQSTRAANWRSSVYGASAFAWADHFTGRRTLSNPAALIVLKYSALSVTPHSPSFGASSALPKLIPRPSALFAARTSGGSAARTWKTTAVVRQRMDRVVFIRLSHPREGGHGSSCGIVDDR